MNNMFSPGLRHPATVEYQELQVPFSIPGDDFEADRLSQERGETLCEDKQERLLHQQSPPSLGKPIRKKKIHMEEVFIMLISLLCLVKFCAAGEDSSGAYTHQSLMNLWSVVLLDHPSPGDQSLQYIGLPPDPGIDYSVECSNFSDYAQL